MTSFAVITLVTFLPLSWWIEAENFCHIELWPTFQFYNSVLRLTFLNVIHVWGHLPSTEWRKCRPLATNNKCCGNRQTDPHHKLLRLLAAKFETEPPIFFSRPIGPVGLYKNSKTKFQNSPPFLRYLGKTVSHCSPFLR